ncbi:hypothetical protein LWE69_12610 [Paenibacillus sp. UKAQ_18]|nr:hypothetical protein [Paenibacillus sp. UKAQ_18]
MELNQELQEKTLDSCAEYFEAYAKTYGKAGFVYLKNDETGQLMIYTRGEYTDKLLGFLKTLGPNMEERKVEV